MKIKLFWRTLKTDAETSYNAIDLEGEDKMEVYASAFGYLKNLCSEVDFITYLRIVEGDEKEEVKEQ